MASGVEIALVGAAAGGAYLLAKEQREAVASLPVGTGIQAPTSGPNVSDHRTEAAVRPPVDANATNAAGTAKASLFWGAYQNGGTGAIYGDPAQVTYSDAEVRAYIERVKAEWQGATREARCAAFEQVKKDLASTSAAGSLDSLNCDSDFDDITAAIVGTAAAEGCARYPKTAALAPLCGAVGTLAGKLLGQGVEKLWGEVKDAVSDGAEKLVDYATFW